MMKKIIGIVAVLGMLSGCSESPVHNNISGEWIEDAISVCKLNDGIDGITLAIPRERDEQYSWVVCKNGFAAKIGY